MNRRTFLADGTRASLGLAALPAAAFERRGGPWTPSAPPPAPQDATLRLDHNANPLGMPPRARAAILEAMEEVPHYPGPRRAVLVERLARLHGVGADQVVLGSGSTELIRLAVHANATPESRILQASPTYENAMRYAEPFPYRIEQVPLASEFAHDVERMRGLADRWREPTVVYICNPNNPTGTLTPSAQLDEWFASAPDRVFFIVDEAYFPFVDDASYWTAERWANERPNVLVTRTFSKLYGIAGLRIGYGICAAETARRLRPYANRSNPNTLAVVGAIAALEEEGWEERSLAIWAECKEVVTACLDELGLDYFPSHTAFLFHRVRGDQAEYIRRMREHGILVGRRFPPILTHNRLSLSATPGELGRFVETLKLFRTRGWV
ncbi:MAG: aminotransferase class I/II-fold pyridoxal phosphate-dependent enzyme [Gammaproteobacteria bacterium]|nr:aminotransferase class I/II-fold pyridoxal phosphate-dependent enzyme [Gammaproteobacteria bacterium]